MMKPKDWNNGKWHWCSKDTGGKCHGNWRKHKPTDCKGTARPKIDDKPRPQATIRANAATIQEDDTDHLNEEQVYQDTLQTEDEMDEDFE